MSDAGDRSFLSIGEVLDLLKDEFPDVTISKIRFLESQGLLDPERTPSGYRKFYEDDITVSRRHVQLDKDGQGYVLRDVGSLNGTYVNRERVDEVRLAHGDEVQIGRYRLSFVLGGSAAS